MLERLRGLDSRDLTDLSSGLQAVAAGDLTVDALPSTEPIENPGRVELGDMTRTFNQMLVKTNESLASYTTMREQLLAMLGQISQTSNTVSSASAQIASSSDETDGAERTREGAVVVEQTREAFLQIGASVDEITERVESIAAASHEIVEGARALGQRRGARPPRLTSSS